MRLVYVAAVALALTACSPAAPPSEETYATGSSPTPANADWGPYADSWDSNAFSHFRHTLNAAAPGPHQLTLTAETSAPGGETVSIYQVGPDGEPVARIMFVVASAAGESHTETIEFPADGANVPVEVVVENASGNRYAGSYTLTISP